ncbi:MAG: phasin family protein [Rhodospirillales bacterium]|nr:phasin family protein [Rhodospirillales bacterium]
MARKFGEMPVPETPVEAASEATAPVVPTALPAPQTAAATPTAAAQFDKATTEATANMEKAMKTAEELVTFGQGNLEALVKSSQIWAAGVQDLGKQVAASAQAQVDQTMATLKALASVKSLKDVLELQSTLARSSVEKAVAETGKLTDASLKLAEQTLAPITARMSLAAERFVRPV